MDKLTPQEAANHVTALGGWGVGIDDGDWLGYMVKPPPQFDDIRMCDFFIINTPIEYIGNVEDSITKGI